MIVKNIEMLSIQSLNIRKIGYDDDNQELHVELISGEKGIYKDVPISIFEELLGSKSPSTFMRAFTIGGYAYIESDSCYALKKASAPLVAYLQKFHCPHNQVIVGFDYVKVTGDVMGVPFECED